MSNDSTMIGPCLVENCTRCFSNSSRCDVCSSTFFPLDVSKTQCIKQGSSGYVMINAGLSSATMRPCKTNDCSKCPGSGQYCETCSASLLLTPENTCVANNIPGFGKDKGEQKQCTTENCSNCFEDYKACKKCKIGMIFNKGGQCIKTTKFMRIVNKPVLNSGTMEFEVVFSDKITEQSDFKE